MLHGVNAGDVRTTHHESITTPIHVLPTDGPSSACPPVRLSTRVYTLLWRDELYIFSCFLALLIGDGRSECPLGTLSLLTCEYAAGLVLYSVFAYPNVNVSFFISSSCRSWTSLMISPLGDNEF